MSTIDRCSVQAVNEERMRKTGKSLAETLYSDCTTISLVGELGTGKTTLVRGLAQGLGIEHPVTSPSFALEQRYDDKLLHLDLYRLSEKEADEFLLHAEDFPGIRAIEWAERSTTLKFDITIKITEDEDAKRSVDVSFLDVKIPTEKIITEWIREMRLPGHILRHMNLVATVAAETADNLIRQGKLIRKKALIAAAKVHDLLRFVDFASFEGNEIYRPTEEDKRVWKELKNRYGAPHEKAAERFLVEHGYGGIGTIVRTHRGFAKEGDPPLELITIEQKILAYADKRARFDTLVSLDERFDDIVVRFGKGKETDHAKKWRAKMKEIERELLKRSA